MVKYQTNKTKLRIGCGLDHEGDYINLDISDYCNPDIVHDIREGLDMFSDNQIEEIEANGVLEMILPNEEFRLVLNELWRVLKPGGHLLGQVPSTDQRVLCLDPWDRRWFKEETFNYFNVNENAWNQFGRMYKLLGWHVHKAKVNDNGIIIFDMSPVK